MFCKKFCKMFCRKCFAENVLQKKFCRKCLAYCFAKKFCRKAFAKMFCKMFCKDFSLTKEFSWDGLFLFPIFKRVLLFSNTILKNTSSPLVLHYQYPQQCGDRSHQVDDQEYLWPRPENAKGCSLCFLREINRTNFLRQYVYFILCMTYAELRCKCYLQYNEIKQNLICIYNIKLSIWQGT